MFFFPKTYICFNLKNQDYYFLLFKNWYIDFSFLASHMALSVGTIDHFRTKTRISRIFEFLILAKLKKLAEAVIRRCSVKSSFLKILQNLHENTWAKVSFYSILRKNGSFSNKTCCTLTALFVETKIYFCRCNFGNKQTNKNS